MVPPPHKGLDQHVITIFLWGYWGWGNATEKLVEMVDLVERSRSFLPPFFVDARHERKGRAKGFYDDAFGRTIPGRYAWMDELGNASTNKSESITIKNPWDGASRILDLSLAESQRRVIVFCSCEMPYPDGPGNLPCHRVVLGDLVLAAARSRGLQADVVEWPGGNISTEPLYLDISPKELGRKKVPIPATLIEDGLPVSGISSLPWGATIACSDCKSARKVVGPPKLWKGKWILPTLDERVATDRGKYGFAPKNSPNGQWWEGRELREISELIVK